MKTHKEIRESFLNFFGSKEHKILESAPLVTNDPTLLFNNAGMAPLKEYFFKRKEGMPRAVSIQKCLRTVDLENVGNTARHHTFFEMLGNFSFGDYFKKEACSWAWEFLTVEMKLPKKEMWITIYEGDEEARKAWLDIGIAKDRIVETKENFWTMGDTGPCGPCSEIIIDRGPDKGCGKKDCSINCGCDRFLELWNLVFTQFNRQASGELLPLSQKNIDTGMGLERLVSVMQSVDSGFETDLFSPVIDYMVKKYDLSKKESKTGLHIIADHCRAATFLISEGVHPSNEEKGYVLRRILRRAIRYAKKWSDEPFLYKLSPIIVETMKGVYPELEQKREYISSVILEEEKDFSSTLKQGSRIMDEIISRLKKEGKKIISGKDAFKLYDTYGFPFDLIKDIAAETGFSVDEAGYGKEMDAQRTRSRDKREKKEFIAQNLGNDAGFESVFLREVVSCKGNTKLILKNGQQTDSLAEGDEGSAAFDKTCFYPESGGQMSDSGRIYSDSFEAIVPDTQKSGKIILHTLKITKGKLIIGDNVNLEIDTFKRNLSARHHTATHLLQAALRQVLGSHVEQRGSLVSPDYLRFDFTHMPLIKKEELEKVEEIVNHKIAENLKVTTVVTSLSEAKKMQAMAIFQEKYDEANVNVVSVGEPVFSRELCGGTHAERTGEIGFFKIMRCEGIAKGIRRIEAVCGWSAYSYVKSQIEIISETSALLNVPGDKIPSTVNEYIQTKKAAESALKDMRKLALMSRFQEFLDKKEKTGDVSVIGGQLGTTDYESMLSFCEKIESMAKPCVCFFGSVFEGKIIIIARASRELKEKLDLSEIIKAISVLIKGGGGGDAVRAQAQGNAVENLLPALDKIRQLIKEQL